MRKIKYNRNGKNWIRNETFNVILEKLKKTKSKNIKVKIKDYEGKLYDYSIIICNKRTLFLANHNDYILLSNTNLTVYHSIYKCFVYLDAAKGYIDMNQHHKDLRWKTDLDFLKYEYD